MFSSRFLVRLVARANAGHAKNVTPSRRKPCFNKVRSRAGAARKTKESKQKQPKHSANLEYAANVITFVVPQSPAAKMLPNGRPNATQGDSQLPSNCRTIAEQLPKWLRGGPCDPPAAAQGPPGVLKSTNSSPQEAPKPPTTNFRNPQSPSRRAPGSFWDNFQPRFDVFACLSACAFDTL